MNDNAKIMELVQKVAGKPVAAGTDESLFESGLLDSFTLTDLVGELENEFGIRIPDSELTPRKFDTVDRIAAYVAAKRG